MRIKGIVLLSSLLLILGQFLNTALPAHSVEFGIDATGDPNAVSVAGSSAFLYSDRIVFTAAHMIAGLEDTTPEDLSRQIKLWETNVSVSAPGVSNPLVGKKYKVKKVLVPQSYRSRVGEDKTRVNDFAILILEESIPMSNQVVVASESDINTFIREKSPVSMVGYGLQDPSQRTPPQNGARSPRKMTSYLISNSELKTFYQNIAGWDGKNQTILDYGIPNTEKLGSVCDSDSGAGFYVEKGATRYYLGAVGGAQAAITNCQTFTRFSPLGGMSGITGAYKNLALVKEAELLVAADKEREFAKAEELRIAAELKAKQEADAKAVADKAAAELKAKQEADAASNAAADLKAKQEADAKAAALAVAQKKATITCVKGKLTKKVTAVNPKCPTGYKIKK